LVCVPLAQVGDPQLVPEEYNWQAAVVPLQTPLLPQAFAP
jgi:hypothetical protein